MTNYVYLMQLHYIAYHSWMKDKGGSIVNIIAVVAKGLPGMAYVRGL